MSTCDKHDAFYEMLNNIRVDQAQIKNDIDWLKKDREEQKARYDKRRNFIRKLHYGTGVALCSAFWYLFEHKENVRMFLKEWLR